MARKTEKDPIVALEANVVPLDNAGMAKAVSDINKRFGKGSIFLMDSNDFVEVDVTGTSSLKLDRAMRGYAAGRIVEIYGWESSGKTTIAILGMIEFQKKGMNVAIVDVEHAFDREYAETLGLDLSRATISQPNCAEDALEMMELLVDSGAFGAVLLDSVAALVSKREIEGEMGDSMIGVTAKMMSQAMRKLTPKADKKGTTLIFINQLREKIGVMFGNPEVTTGGNALKFYATTRMRVSKQKALEDVNKEVIGQNIKIKVEKNKISTPFKTVELKLYFGVGFDKNEELVSLAVEDGVVTRAGSWYSYGDVRMGQGEGGAVEFLRDNPDLFEEIKSKLKNG